jgi:predicted dehydrogenase
MRIALVGCGFVADFYMATLRHYSAFVVAGVYDWDRSRLEAFSRQPPGDALR